MKRMKIMVAVAAIALMASGCALISDDLESKIKDLASQIASDSAAKSAVKKLLADKALPAVRKEAVKILDGYVADGKISQATEDKILAVYDQAVAEFTKEQAANEVNK